MAFLIGGANSAADTGFEVANSCRFNSDAYLHKQLGTATNNKLCTVSLWVKPQVSDTRNTFISGGINGDNYQKFRTANDSFSFYGNHSGSNNLHLEANRKLRDPSAFYHVVMAFDSTQASSSNRIKIYVNGVQETSMNNATYPAEDAICYFNAASTSDIFVGAFGRQDDTIGEQGEGYFAEVCVIDGLALDPTSFGEYSETTPNLWIPKDVSGLTFGNNGFYLDFEASDNLGNDVNGGTDLTAVSLDATDQASDTPTNNFCTFNPLIGVHHTSTGVPDLSQGNCHMAEVASPTHGTTLGTMGSTKMKFYFEYKLHSAAADIFMGVMGQPFPQSTSNHAYNDVGAYGYYGESSQSYKITAGVQATDSTFSGDGIYMFAIDPTNNKLWVGKDGTWDGDPAAGSGEIVTLGTHEYLPWAHCSGTSGDNSISANFGGCPAFTISSGNADAEGYGNFEYEVPSGFYSLCTKNLAEYG